MICAHCGTDIADKALICYKCGHATETPKVAPPKGWKPKTRRSPVTTGALVVLILLVLALVIGLLTGVINVHITSQP